MLGFIGHPVEGGLPKISFDSNELEDVKWFSKGDVMKALTLDGSVALSGWQPNESEKLLHFPGNSSLARKLLRDWVFS
jgi:hypothetical protein